MPELSSSSSSNHLCAIVSKGAEAPLKSAPQNQHHYGATTTDCWQPNDNNEAKTTNHLPPFRFAIGLMLVLASTLYHYAANSLAIVSVAMVVGDVRDRGFTQIRTRHLSIHPTQGASAALPGTCPIELYQRDSTEQLQWQSLEAMPPKNSTNSLAELTSELTAFDAQVQVRLSNGELIDWSIGQRALMITAVSLGKLICALPMGRLSYAHGNYLTLLLSLLAAAALALLLPLTLCSTPFWFAFLFGLLTGGLAAATEFVSYPLAAHWFLPDEASAVTGLLHISVVMGTTLTFFVSGQLLSNNLPWTWCFYLPGALLLILALLWSLLGAESPEESRFVTRKELAVLQFSVSKCNSLKQQQLTSFTSVITCKCVQRLKNTCPATKQTRKPNWRKLFTCPTVWTLAAFNFAHSWDTALKSYWSTFFANILHLDAATTGAFMGLRGLLVLIYSPLFVYSTRKLATHRPFNMSLLSLRRMAAILGLSVLVGLVALLVVLDCNPVAVMVSVMLRPLVTSLNMISYAQVPLDVAPDDGALIMAYTRLVGFGDVLALPVSSGILAMATGNHQSAAEVGDRYSWRLVWLLGLIISSLACLLFVCFADLSPKSYSYQVPSGTCQSLVDVEAEKKQSLRHEPPLVTTTTTTTAATTTTTTITWNSV